MYVNIQYRGSLSRKTYRFQMVVETYAACDNFSKIIFYATYMDSYYKHEKFYQAHFPLCPKY